MDNNTTSQPQNQTTNATDWFDSLPTPPVQPPKKKSFKRFALIAASIILVGSVSAAFVVANQGPKCLTTDDLKGLLEQTDIDPVSSASNYFFNYQIEFQANSNTYSSSVSPTGSEITKQLGDFYKKHPDKSIVLTLSSTYFDDSAVALTNQRLATVRSDLIAADIPSDNIATEGPVKDTPEDSSEQINTVTVAITSATTCK